MIVKIDENQAAYVATTEEILGTRLLETLQLQERYVVISGQEATRRCKVDFSSKRAVVFGSSNILEEFILNRMSFPYEDHLAEVLVSTKG